MPFTSFFSVRMDCEQWWGFFYYHEHFICCCFPRVWHKCLMQSGDSRNHYYIKGEIKLKGTFLWAVPLQLECSFGFNVFPSISSPKKGDAGQRPKRCLQMPFCSSRPKSECLVHTIFVPHPSNVSSDTCLNSNGHCVVCPIA